MGSARQRLLREARIAGSMGFSPGLLSLGKHAGMQADTGLCNLPAFCRAPTPWTTLCCKAGSVQAPKQSGQKIWIMPLSPETHSCLMSVFLAEVS